MYLDKSSGLSPRRNPVVMPIGQGKIAIMGGKNAENCLLGDVVIFDTRKETFHSIVKDKSEEISTDAK